MHELVHVSQNHEAARGHSKSETLPRRRAAWRGLHCPEAAAPRGKPWCCFLRVQASPALPQNAFRRRCSRRIWDVRLWWFCAMLLISFAVALSSCLGVIAAVSTAAAVSELRRRGLYTSPVRSVRFSVQTFSQGLRVILTLGSPHPGNSGPRGLRQVRAPPSAQEAKVGSSSSVLIKPLVPAALPIQTTNLYSLAVAGPEAPRLSAL